MVGPPTVSEYEMAIGCIWYDDAVMAGLIDGPSGVEREPCLDVIARGKEHDWLEHETADDLSGDGRVAWEMVVSLACVNLELDPEDEKVSDVVERVLQHAILNASDK